MKCAVCNKPMTRNGMMHEDCRAIPIPDETKYRRQLHQELKEMTTRLIGEIHIDTLPWRMPD